MTTVTPETIFLTLYASLFLGIYLGMATFLGLILFTRPPQKSRRIHHVHSISKKKLAEEFKPIIKQSRSLKSPLPTEIWYEIVPIDSKYTIINYRVKWPSEIHPNPVVDTLYRIFRTFYYGSSEDIEIIQLVIDLEQGKAMQIRLETDSSNDPDVFISDHVKVTLKRRHGNSFEIWNRKTKIGETTIIFQKKRPIIEVLTWNHVFAVKYSNQQHDLHDLPLRPLTDYLYRRYRLDRRSHFDGLTPPAPRKADLKKSSKTTLAECIFLGQLAIFLTLMIFFLLL